MAQLEALTTIIDSKYEEAKTARDRAKRKAAENDKIVARGEARGRIITLFCQRYTSLPELHVLPPCLCVSVRVHIYMNMHITLACRAQYGGILPSEP